MAIPPSLVDVDEELPDIWEFWQGTIGTNERAQAYLRCVASTDFTAQGKIFEHLGWKKANSATQILSNWRKKYRGWKAIERELWANPRYAIEFTATLGEGLAVNYFTNVLAGVEKGNKAEAARKILRHAELRHSRDTHKKREAGILPPEPKESRLEALMNEDFEDDEEEKAAV